MRVQGLAQVDAVCRRVAAEDAAKKAMEHRVCNVTVTVNGGSRVRPPRAQPCGVQASLYPERDARAAQGCGCAKVLLRTPTASSQGIEKQMARYTGAVCRAGASTLKLFLKGERCYNCSGTSVGAYPPGQQGREPLLQAFGLRRAAAREAERSSASRTLPCLVPRLLPQGVVDDGRHGSHAICSCRALRLDNVVYRMAPPAITPRRAVSSPPRPLHDQRQEGQHPVVPRSPARCRAGLLSRRRKRASTRRSAPLVHRRRPAASSSTRGQIPCAHRSAAVARGRHPADRSSLLLSST